MPMIVPPRLVPARHALAIVCLAVGLFGCPGGGPADPILDSNTNWLSACASDDDCRLDARCICGQCTSACTDDAQCTSPNAGLCATPGDSSWDAMCTSAAPPVCLPICTTDADCDASHYCIAGGCVPRWAESTDVPDPDAGRGDGGLDGGGPGDAGTTDAGPQDVGPVDADPDTAPQDAEPSDARPGDTGEDTDPTDDVDLDAPDTSDVDPGDGGGPTCVEDGEMYCGRRVGFTDSLAAASLYSCMDGEWVRIVTCGSDCVYVRGSNDLCIESCPTADPRQRFCGSDLGLPPENVYSCADGRVLLEGVCIEVCGTDAAGFVGCTVPDGLDDTGGSDGGGGGGSGGGRPPSPPP